MHCFFCLILVIVSYATQTSQTVVHSVVHKDQNRLNDAHFTWILYPPWKYYNDSVEYFGIIGDDRLTNESFLETSSLTVFKNVQLTFSSKVDRSPKQINLILYTYQCKTWNKTWEYVHNHSQWQLHQLSINLIDGNEDIRFRFLPISKSSDSIFIAITIANLTTQTKPPSSNPSHRCRNPLSIPLLLLVIFGGVLLLLFMTIMAAFTYGLIKKVYNQWLRKRSSRRRRKCRKNIVRDESTVLDDEAHAV